MLIINIPFKLSVCLCPKVITLSGFRCRMKSQFDRNIRQRSKELEREEEREKEREIDKKRGGGERVYYIHTQTKTERH